MAAPHSTGRDDASTSGNASGFFLAGAWYRRAYAPAVRFAARLLSCRAASKLSGRGRAGAVGARSADQRRGEGRLRLGLGHGGAALPAVRILRGRLPGPRSAGAARRRARALHIGRFVGVRRRSGGLVAGSVGRDARRSTGRPGAAPIRESHAARRLERRAPADGCRPGWLTSASDSHPAWSCRDFPHKEVVMVRAILSFLSMLLWAPALALAQAGGQGGGGAGGTGAGGATGTGAGAGAAGGAGTAATGGGGGAWVWWFIVAIIVLAIIWWAAGSGRRRRPVT